MADISQAWSALVDFVLAIFPWLLIWGVQMKTAEKVGLIIAMSLGILYVGSRQNVFRPAADPLLPRIAQESPPASRRPTLPGSGTMDRSNM